MPGQYNFEKRSKYPHLLGEDIVIWNQFIENIPDRYDTVDYDVHVGTGIEPPDEQDINFSNQWRNLTRKRIDVIAWKKDSPTIIEVKFRVGLDTLGQILGYQLLYGLEHPEYINSPILILCAFISGDDITVLEHFKVPWLIP